MKNKLFTSLCIALGNMSLSNCTKKEKEQFEGNKKNDTADTRHHPGMDK